MRPHRHLLVATVLVGLGLVPRMGAAQAVSTSRSLYVTYDAARSTCLLPEASAATATSGRCYIMECDASGGRCSCPLALPNGWKQPLTLDQCRQLDKMLAPLPPLEPSAAAGKQVAQGKGKDEERKLYTVRLQAQGDGVEESVVLMDFAPITVAGGLQGLEILKGKLSRKELDVRTDLFRRAERMIRSGPPNGIGPPGQSFALFKGSPIRVDVEIKRGINFRE
jgi:hypothetical protein